MQTPSFPALQARFRNLTLRDSQRPASSRYFATHPVGQVVRSLFFSSVLWVALAFVLYTVYTMVAGKV
jgi:hypothetical protein